MSNVFLSKDGVQVVVREGSHVIDHGMLDLFARGVARINIAGEKFVIAGVDFNEVVGHNHLVRDEEGVGFFFATRGDRAGCSKMANTEPVPCSSVVIILAWDEEEQEYYGITCYVGFLAPREPWDPTIQDDPRLLQESRDFWRDHSLVPDGPITLWDTRDFLSREFVVDPITPPGWEWLIPDMWD
jgi:hypothetical protein